MEAVQNIHRVRLLNTHCIVLILISALSFPASYAFYDFLDVITPMTLALLLINNVVFVAANVNLIRHNMLYFLIPVLLINLSIGVVENELSRRTATDTVLLLLFFLKVIIIYRACERSEVIDQIYKFFKKFAIISLVSGVVGMFIFYFYLVSSRVVYFGLTPIISPFYINSLMSGSTVGLIISLIIALLSGKRAIIISVLIVYLVWWYKYRKVSLVKPLILLVVLSICGYFFFQLEVASGAYDKLSYTYEAIVEPQSENDLNKVSGARASEIENSISQMDWFNYLFGKGAGDTYELYFEGNLIDDKHANVHFTPVSILSKYGLVFLAFFIYLFYKSMKNKDTAPVVVFSKIYMVGFIVESLFSYLIFNDRILPFVIGLLLATNKKTR